MKAQLDFNEFISVYYEDVKKALVKEWKRKNKKEFDEDMFHNIIMKCMRIFKEDKKTKDEFTAYMVSAIKNNSSRENQYARNQKRDEVDILNVFDNILIEDKNHMDMEMLLQDITEKFGERKVEMFIDWANGFTIDDIDKKYLITNARYTIDKMRKYVALNYNVTDIR